MSTEDHTVVMMGPRYGFTDDEAEEFATRLADEVLALPTERLRSLGNHLTSLMLAVASAMEDTNDDGIDPRGAAAEMSHWCGTTVEAAILVIASSCRASDLTPRQVAEDIIDTVASLRTV